MRRLILCADDFALSRPISETIVELAHAGKINAISCMAVCPGWERDAELLADLPARVQVGLHLTLTGEAPLTRAERFAPQGRMPEIDPLTRDAMLGRVPLAEIAAEVDAQLARFVAARGRAPDFVDGHQHAHLLPGIRGVVLAATARHAPGAWLRDCTDRPQAIARRPWRLKAIGSAFHSQGLRRAGARHGLACNRGFAGHYDYRSDFASVFPQFLRDPGTQHLVMCHPGAGQAAGDTIAAARIGEANALRRLPIADIAAAHGLEFAA